MKLSKIPFQLKNVLLLLFCLALAVLGWWNYGETGKGQYLLEGIVGSLVFVLCLVAAIYPLVRKNTLKAR